MKDSWVGIFHFLTGQHHRIGTDDIDCVPLACSCSGKKQDLNLSLHIKFQVVPDSRVCLLCLHR